MNEISYKIIRSDRKSIALIIDGGANILIRAPWNTPDGDIADFVEQKRQWIADKRRQISDAAEKHKPVVVADGESLPYLGNTLTVKTALVPCVQLSGETILVPVGCSVNDVAAWMREEAVKVFAERVSLYARSMGTAYSAVRLTEAKARWGSCSCVNVLRFSWRLIMCPLKVIDYVAVHELSHVDYKNHGKRFWARVGAVLPDFGESREWLKVNRRLMDII